MDARTGTEVKVTKILPGLAVHQMCDGMLYREDAQVFVPCANEPSLRMVVNNPNNDVIYSCLSHAAHLIHVSLVSS